VGGDRRPKSFGEKKKQNRKTDNENEYRVCKIIRAGIVPTAGEKGKLKLEYHQYMTK
jgi:hypothetical protein